MRHSLAESIHPGAYIQSTDPADDFPERMQAKILWVDTASTPNVLKKRNDDNDDWDVLALLLDTLETPTRTVTASATLDPDSDGVLIVNASADVVIDDEAPTADQRTSYRIFNIGTGGYSVAFTPGGGRTVNGDASYIFSSTGVLHLEWNGSNWVAG